MKHFTVYNPATGEVQYTGGCSDSTFDLQKPLAPFAIIEGDFAADKFFWDGEQMREKPPRPGLGFEWNCAARDWVCDIPAHDRSARARRALLLQEADRAVNKLEDAGQDSRPARVYRQALRDLTAQPGYPLTIVWPVLASQH